MGDETGDWDRLETVFAQAADLSDDERARFCGELSFTDPALARELASLLNFDSTANQRLQGIMDRMVADAASLPQWSGQSFGSYRVVRTIATGGMGTVFEAVREQDYRKRVALKVAASAIGTPAWVERFQLERQILAGLDHPHIARFLDGGASADGLPYFAMELVEGEPITDFIRNRKVSLRSRIELFRKVCAAVSFAHQSLIVHRDLKPGNILVTAEGEPKLLDFGLAKLQSPLEPQLGLTQTAMPLLTPSYCSPEQVLGGRITTRVDVYLLGLILFELLTGEQAHQLTSGSPAELQRVVSEAEAPVPSMRAEVAGQAALAKSLRGDLDTIVVKAIQKDPERRYQSVDELNEDLARYLDGRPILARRAGWSYRTAKFLRRNWIPASAAGIVLLTLIGAVLAFALEARIARRRFDLARGMANALLFDIHDRVQAMPGAINLQEQISSTAVKYLDALSREAGRNYALRRELAAGYLRLGSARWLQNEAAPGRAGADSTLATLNRALALLDGMPAPELAQASATEAQLRAHRGTVLAENATMAAAAADFERAVALSPCSADRPQLCQNRIVSLAHLVDSDVARRDWDSARRRLTQMQSSMEAYGTAGGETAYHANSLHAGMVESHMLLTRGDENGALEIMRHLLPVAAKLGAQPRLEAPTLNELELFYQTFARRLRRLNKGTAEERIEFSRRGLEMAQRWVQLDGSDVAARLAVGYIQAELAHNYEAVDRAKAAEWHQEAIESYLRHPEVIANGLSPKALFYEMGEDGMQFFLRTHQPEKAVSLALRVSSALSPAMFLGLKLPRSEAVQRTQALWWTASEAVAENAGSAEKLWGEAVRAGQEGMSKTPRDASMQASAAFAFEGWAEWLHSAGRQVESEAFGKQAHGLWTELSAAFPANGFIRKRAQGASFEHQKD